MKIMPAENFPPVFPVINSRPRTAKLALAVFMAAQTLGWTTLVGSAEAESAGATNSDSLPDVRRALREFDRFLDHHPLLENQLLLDPSLTAQRAFLERQTELRTFLAANPKILAGLALYPRYFLNRALLRQASAPVSFAELAPFRDLFQKEPEIQKHLSENPELIRDADFLKANPVLHDCIVQHPALSRVFLPPPVAFQAK